MDDQLKIAQMNSKAVVEKLMAQDAIIAAQTDRISALEQKMAQLDQKMNAQLQAAFAAKLGSGPTV